MTKKISGILLLIFLFFYLDSPILATTKKMTPRYYKSGISDRKLLQSAAYNVNEQRRLHKSSSTPPDTLQLLAIRVEFQQDNDRKTTGDGTFFYELLPIIEPLTKPVINPPPHDRNYFINQLRALADYYKKVSRGKLILAGDVYPLASTRAYQLPRQMSYYNPNSSDEVLDQRLSELFRDAFVAADTSDNIEFSKYDCFIMFHAGVGSEYTFDLDTTPNDIPSVFLNFQDLKKTIGRDDPAFEGIRVRGHVIRDGIILPETQSQMGYNIGLLGTAALMFGHQIGLPNLYDSDTGQPGIGLFGLMDQGSSNFGGLIPAQPCAWSKVFLGWEEPIEVASGIDLSVAATLASSSNNVYKVPLNAKEYFLIENRQRHVLKLFNIAIGYDDRGTRVEFKADGNVNPPSPDDSIGVIVQVDEYDYGLPGSGILIWHIDENVIAARYGENRINTDKYHRGVDLVEADGAQDIGHFLYFFGFTGYDSGNEWDMWWSKNEAHLYANNATSVAFTPYTMPQSRPYSGANSHIYITNFSDSKPVMTFTLSINTQQSNFPQVTGANMGDNSVVIGDIDGVSGAEIVTASVDGKIFAWHSDGSKVIDNTDSLLTITVNGINKKYSLALFAHISDSVLSTPALADMDADGDLEVIVASKTGVVSVFQGTDKNPDGRGDLFWRFDTGYEISTSPHIINFEKKVIAVGHSNGKVTTITNNGNLLWHRDIALDAITGIAKYSHSTVDSVVVTSRTSISLLDPFGDTLWQRNISKITDLLNPAVGDLNNDGRLDIVICGAKGGIAVLDRNGEQMPGFEHTNQVVGSSNPTIADLDHNGYLEIIIYAEGYLYAYHYNGTLYDNFPIRIDSSKEGYACPEPIIADLDGDDDAEMIIAANNQLLAFHHTGEKVDGFPLSVGGKTFSVPFLADVDGDGFTELSLAAGDGYVYLWNLGLAYNADDMLWQCYLHDPEHSSRYTSRTVPVSPPKDELMPSKTVYNWPNPTEGNSTQIRFWLNEDAMVNIRIYDMAGELVKEINSTGMALTANELLLDLQNMQSGVYLTRVEAKNSNKRNISFFKMAVVK